MRLVMTLVSSRRCGRRRLWPPSPRPSSPLPGPETAVFGCSAPCAPIQKRHTEPIYYGKRLGRLHAPREGPDSPSRRATVDASLGRLCSRRGVDSPPLSCARRLRSASAAGASAAAESPPRKVRAPKWRRKPGRTQKAPGAPITRRKQVPCRPEGSRTVGQHATPGRSPKTSPKKLHPGRQAPGARTRQFVCQHRQTTICLSATSRARRRLPGETHRRRGTERGEKVLARAAARPRGRGRGHRGPGHGQHGGLLGHACSNLACTKRLASPSSRSLSLELQPLMTHFRACRWRWASFFRIRS